MRASIIALAVLLASSSPAFADAVTAPVQGHVITGPDWVTRPDANLMARYYPVGAWRLRVDGRAAVACVVAAAGTLNDCRIVAEAPVGYGFGEAALMVAAEFHMKPMTRDGVPVDGGRITIPISFRAPPKTWAQKLGILR